MGVFFIAVISFFLFFFYSGKVGCIVVLGLFFFFFLNLTHAGGACPVSDFSVPREELFNWVFVLNKG